ncbi:MAG: small multi-drug export protein [Clostridia bacterium]|nr:small multi-drug export protein [Clostridia bacterium]
MTEFIKNLVGNDIIATVVMSIVPLIELKGGIVFARGIGQGFFSALGLAYLGSTIVFIPIYFLLRPILNLLKNIKFVGKLAFKVENYFKSKADDTIKKQSEKKSKKPMSETLLKQLGVFIFVAIPLSMTGVWTGTAIAVFLGLKFKDVILPIALGNLVAGLIISALAELCLAVWTIAVLDYILYGLFALALILLVVVIIKILIQKSSSAPDGENKE